jgi:3-hydroxyisobutyrate dehydrogenase-like beta-hydroxyacid dehydrogenase
VARNADTVFLSVPNGDATLGVVAEIAECVDRRTKIVIDLSTIGPDAAAKAASIMRGAGIEYCDGPVSGGAAGARAGTISLMFGGPTAVLDEHRPLLSTSHMTKDVGLFVDSAVAIGTSHAVAAAVNDTWRAADEAIPGSDFTEIWKHVSAS